MPLNSQSKSQIQSEKEREAMVGKPLSPAAQPQLLRRVMSADAAVSERLHSLSQAYLPRRILLLLELSADFRLFFPICLACLLLDLPLLHPFLVSLLLGLLLDLAAVGLLKIAVRRARPHYNRDMSVAVGPDHFSFPSGHSSRVFLVAALQEVSGAGLVPGGVWSWAVATSVSRVVLGRHFVTDVVAGACLGIVEGLFAFHFLSLALW